MDALLLPSCTVCSQERQVTLPSTPLLSLYPSKRPLSPMFFKKKKKTWSNNLDNFRLISNFQFISKILNPTVKKKFIISFFFPPPSVGFTSRSSHPLSQHRHSDTQNTQFEASHGDFINIHVGHKSLCLKPTVWLQLIKRKVANLHIRKAAACE